MKTIFFVPALFFVFSVSAQEPNTKNIKEQKIEVLNKAEPTAPSPTVTPLPTTDGANLSPEQQGYTKQTINGKEVYVKQSGQMIFYYEPKK